MKSVLAFSFLFAPLFAAEPVKVTVASLGDVSIYPAFEAPAQVVAKNETTLPAEVSAPVREILVAPGDTIAQGQTLVKLDAREYEYQLLAAIGEKEATEAQLELAQLEEQRFKRLLDQKTVADGEYMLKLNEYKMVMARIKARLADMNAAKLRWQKCEIKAPFSGVVTERLVAVGELTQPGSPLLTLVELKDPYVLAQLPHHRAGTVAGAESLVFVTGDQRYPLRLKAMSSVVNAATRTNTARLEFVSDQAAPGSSGRLEWRTGAPSLPAHLIVTRDGQSGVMLAKDGKAHFHPIPQASEGSPAAVDLPPDAKIIVEGRLGLSHNDAITVQ